MGHLKGFMASGNPRSLFAAFLYFDTSFMVWVILGALGNFVASEMGLSGTQKGLMTALPVLSGAVLRLPMGILADRFGSRPVGIAGLSLTLVPLTAGWLLADSLQVVYLVGILLGVAGASFAVALPLASRWYPAEHQGLALGIAGAGNSGTVIASLFAPRLAEAFGWQAVFGLAMLPILLTLAVFVVMAKDHPGPRSERQSYRLSAYPARARRVALLSVLQRHVRRLRGPRHLPGDLLQGPVRRDQGYGRRPHGYVRFRRQLRAASRRPARRPLRRHSCASGPALRRRGPRGWR